MTMDEHGLGLILPEEHPRALEAATDPRNWPMTALMEGITLEEPPAEYTCPGLQPVSFDQDGVGACVAANGVHVQNTEQRVDIGIWPYDNRTMFLAYSRLKRGWKDWPGDGIPDVEGSFPQAYLEMARKVGVEGTDGRAWKISAWYSHTLASPDDLLFLQNVLMRFGPICWGIPWPSLWFTPPKASNDWKMPPPTGGIAGGHAFSTVGWKTYSNGVWLTHVQSWGPSWSNSQGIFRTLADWYYRAPLGPQLIHKVVDFDDPPEPTPPPPGGDEIVKASDAIPRTFDCAIGVQFYKSDAVTPLVKLSSGGVGLYSPCSYDSSNFNVRISTGGIAQLAVVRKSDCTNVKLYAADCTDKVAAERNRWLGWHGQYPK